MLLSWHSSDWHSSLKVLPLHVALLLIFHIFVACSPSRHVVGVHACVCMCRFYKTSKNIVHVCNNYDVHSNM